MSGEKRGLCIFTLFVLYHAPKRIPFLESAHQRYPTSPTNTRVEINMTSHFRSGEAQCPQHTTPASKSEWANYNYNYIHSHSTRDKQAGKKRTSAPHPLYLHLRSTTSPPEDHEKTRLVSMSRQNLGDFETCPMEVLKGLDRARSVMSASFFGGLRESESVLYEVGIKLGWQVLMSLQNLSNIKTFPIKSHQSLKN